LLKSGEFGATDVVSAVEHAEQSIGNFVAIRGVDVSEARERVFYLL
jgi:hypothetical protein